MTQHNENFYTDDFDQEMLDFLALRGLNCTYSGYWDLSHPRLCKWHFNRSYHTTNIVAIIDLVKLTKDEFKRRIGMKVEKEFTLKDLKTGHLAETRGGRQYVVFLYTYHSYYSRGEKCKDVIVEICGGSWLDLEDYDLDLIADIKCVHGYYDIMKVYRLKHPLSFNSDYRHSEKELIWERKEKSKEELQLEEIEATMAKLKQQRDELKKTIKTIKEKK